VYVDGSLRTVERADGARSDVNTSQNGYGAAHGFDFTLGLEPGRHDICVYAINQGPGNTNALIGCRTVNVSSSPIGSLDVAQRQGNNVRIAGWAIDTDTFDAIDVHVYVDGRLVTAAPADLSRDDIGRLFPTYGDQHGYDVTFNAPGARSVCVYGINAGAGTNSLLGCRTIS
jgi:hypothetical protein